MNPTIAKLDKLVTLGVKKTYIEVVIFMSTEVVSSTRNFIQQSDTCCERFYKERSGTSFGFSLDC